MVFAPCRWLQPFSFYPSPLLSLLFLFLSVFPGGYGDDDGGAGTAVIEDTYGRQTMRQCSMRALFLCQYSTGLYIVAFRTRPGRSPDADWLCSVICLLMYFRFSSCLDFFWVLLPSSLASPFFYYSQLFFFLLIFLSLFLLQLVWVAGLRMFRFS